MSGSLCVHCGFDLSLAEGMEDVLLHCPGCGGAIEDAEGQALSGADSDRPTDPFGSSLVPFGAPGSVESRAAIESAEEDVALNAAPAAPAPPAPPTRPRPPSALERSLPDPNSLPVAAAVEAPPSALPADAVNPFMASEAAAGPPPERSPFNPFLQGELASSQPDSVSLRSASPLSQAALRVPVVNLDAPVVLAGDPHAEFRKGRWKKPALIVAVAALGLGAMITLVPEPEAKVAEPTRPGRERAPIGGSVSPLVIEEPEKDFSSKPSSATPPPGTEAKSGLSPSRDFADSFKSQAK